MRGIARCVLLGAPDAVHEQARKLGVKLPAGIEIIVPVLVAGNYVAALVEKRKHRGMTKECAEVELQDSIMVGTMMMALDMLALFPYPKPSPFRNPERTWGLGY